MKARELAEKLMETPDANVYWVGVKYDNIHLYHYPDPQTPLVDYGHELLHGRSVLIIDKDEREKLRPKKKVLGSPS